MRLPIDIATRVSPELSGIIEGLVNDPDVEEPVTLGFVRKWIASGLLGEMARRRNVDPGLTKYLVPPEVAAWFTTRKPTTVELRRRQRGSAYVVTRAGYTIFTGSDVALTRDFSDHFGASAVNILDMTFRFNQRIGEVASRFIQKNPAQIRKDIKSLRSVNDNAVTLIPSNSDADGLDLALTELNKYAKAGSSVLELGRFWFVMPDMFPKLIRQYPQFNIEYMTAHAAKGKEADYVIVLGLVNGKNGFPSSKVSNSLLSLLLPPEEDYKYAEERRLFYVALTRARHHVYLVTHPDKASEFVRELRSDKYHISELKTDLSQNAGWSNEILCPECLSGYLVERKNSARGNIFYACINYPYCEYTQNGCPKCGGLQNKEADYVICTSEKCNYIEPLCPECGGMLRLKSGKYGKFWGCSNYRADGKLSCGYTINNIDLEKLRHSDHIKI